MAHFSNIKIKGSDIHVIFTGKFYYFHSNFYGLLAVAERDTTPERDTETNKMFHCQVGNQHTKGGRLGNSVIYSYIKKHIRKEENRFVSCDVDFDCMDVDLSNNYLSVAFGSY